MIIETYKATENLSILNKLFLIGDEIYVTPSFHVMDGVFDYARKVFDSDKNYLGMIRDDKFPDRLLERAGVEPQLNERVLPISDVSGSYPTANDIWSVARTDDMIDFRKWYNKHFGNYR